MIDLIAVLLGIASAATVRRLLRRRRRRSVQLDHRHSDTRAALGRIHRRERP